jgi:opacity protein-like surface antigen
MKRLYPVALCAAALFGSTSASAQTTPAAQKTSAPTVTVGYAGVATGIAAASKVGVPINAEAGMRVWRQLDVSIEAGWFSNVATGDSTAAAAELVNFLQSTQGQPASAKVKRPAAYGTVNARWVLESGRRYRPYGLLGIGGARVTTKSTFQLGGSDISGSLGQYGITLGQDLSGHSSHPAVTVGVGVIVPWGRWYGDGGYRLTSIMTNGGSTVVNRLNVGGGIRF